ncbi:MAG: hypothetical protein V1743_05235 [Nanoarchaeota archaeon]
MEMKPKKRKKKLREAPLNIFPANADTDYLSIAIASSAEPSLLARCANEHRGRTLEEAVNNGLSEILELRDYIVYLPKKNGYCTEDEMVRFYRRYGIRQEMKDEFYRLFEDDKRMRREMSEAKLVMLASYMPPKIFAYFISALHISLLELQPRPPQPDKRVQRVKEAICTYARSNGYTGEKKYMQFYQQHGLIPSLRQELLEFSEIDRKKKRIANGLLHQLYAAIPHELYNLIAAQAGVRTFSS